MRRLLKWRYAATAAALGLAVACSEDSTNPVAPDNYPPPPTGTLYNVNVTAPNQTFNVGIAQWTTTFPFGVGTGQLDPFLGVQNAPSEEGFNTDASPLPLDDTRSNFTDALPLNNVPIIEESNLLWREFILDANEAQNEGDATFSIDRFDVWVCQDNAAPTYDAVSDFASNSSCVIAYALPDTLLATSDNTSGSGSTLDYRILIPASAFGAAANTACAYDPAGEDCGYYIVLHTEMGHVGGIYVTGSTFEEFSTIKRPVPPQLTLVKEVINDNGGTANASAWTLSATGTSFSFSGVGSPAAGTTASLGPSPVAPGVQYTLSESGGPAGYTAATNWVCTGGGTFVAPDKITLDTAEVVSCKIGNNDNAPSPSLVKVVVNDNGGTAVASDWTLSRSPST